MKKYGEIYLEENPQQFGLGYNMLKSLMSNENYSQTYEHVEKTQIQAPSYRVLGANLTSFYMKSKASHVMVHYTGLKNYYVTVLENNYIDEIPFDKKYNIYFTDKEKLVKNSFYYNYEFFKKIPYYEGEDFQLNKVLFLRQGSIKNQFHLFHPSLFIPALNKKYLRTFYVFLALKLLYKDKTRLVKTYKKKPYNIHDRVVLNNRARKADANKINLVKYLNPYLVLVKEIKPYYSQTTAHLLGYDKAYMDYRDFGRTRYNRMPWHIHGYREVYLHAYTVRLFYYYKLINLNLRNFNLNLMKFQLALKNYNTVYEHEPKMKLTFKINRAKYKRTLKNAIKQVLTIHNLYFMFKYYRKTFKFLPGYYKFFRLSYRKLKLLLYNYRVYYYNLFINLRKQAKPRLELGPNVALKNFYSSFRKRVYFNYAIFRKPYLFEIGTVAIGTNLVDPNNLYINNADTREACLIYKKISTSRQIIRKQELVFHDISNY